MRRASASSDLREARVPVEFAHLARELPSRSGQGPVKLGALGVNHRRLPCALPGQPERQGELGFVFALAFVLERRVAARAEPERRRLRRERTRRVAPRGELGFARALRARRGLPRPRRLDRFAQRLRIGGSPQYRQAATKSRQTLCSKSPGVEAVGGNPDGVPVATAGSMRVTT